MTRSFGLDVMRAVAISGVLLSHALTAGMEGYFSAVPAWADWLGVLGVEVFFALSGFLIGRLLLDIAAQPGGANCKDWLIFMLRRWMRTLPLYVLSILGLSILLPPDRGLTQHIVQYLTLFQNFAWPLSDGWYDVTWSLAVEEWFYLAFSAAFLFASTAVGRRGGLAIIIIFLIVPLSCRFLVPADAPWDAGIRKVMVLRLDSIAYGVAAALFIENSPNVRRHWIILIVAGLALEIIAFLVRGTTLGRPVVFNLMDIGAALCLPAALTFSRISGSAVGWAVTSLSTTSYGIYLVHTPVLRLLRDHSPFLRYHTVLLAVAMLLASIALAGMSWIALEQPILKLRPKQTRRASNAPTASFALES